MHLKPILGVLLCTEMFVALSSSKTACTSQDYRRELAPCDGGKRKVTWVKEPRVEVGRCLGEELVEDGYASCDCTLADYVPVFASEDRTFLTTYTLSEEGICDPTSGFTQDHAKRLPHGATIPGCTPDDIGFEYTSCDSKTNTQRAIAYWLNPCREGEIGDITFDMIPEGIKIEVTRNIARYTADNEYLILLEDETDAPVVRAVGRRLLPYFGRHIGQEIVSWNLRPFAEVVDEAGDLRGENRVEFGRTDAVAFRWHLPPAKTMPCNTECLSGTFMAAPMQDCAFCPPGQHSVRGDIYNTFISDMPELWPENFHTRCYAEPVTVNVTECAKWAIDDGVIFSGDQPPNRHTITFLNIRAVVKTQPAYLRFVYKMELEEEATFYVQINDKVVFAVRKGSVQPWKEIVLPIRTECVWHLSMRDAEKQLVDICVTRNNFKPYTEDIHFPNSLVADATPQTLFHLNNDGCDPDNITDAVSGKVVLIPRHGCFFTQKALNAQSHGAAAVIIYDYKEGGHLRMKGISTNLTIPVVSITLEDFRTLAEVYKRTFSQDFPDSDVPSVSGMVGKEEQRDEMAFIQMVLETPQAKDRNRRKIAIKEIILEGTKYSSNGCRPCPAGYKSSEYSDSCEVCPPGTFSHAGSSSCSECLGGSTSPQGSSSCVAMKSCATQDFLPVLSACSEETHTLNVTYATQCVGGTAPPTTELPCGPESPAFCINLSPANRIKEGTTATCVMCPHNEVPAEGSSACTKCKDNEVLLKQTTYPGFNSLTQILADLQQEHHDRLGPFTTMCLSDCAYGNGWRLQSYTSDTPKAVFAVGANDSTTGANRLTYDFEVDHPGMITFYVTKENAGNASITFTLEQDESDSDEEESGAGAGVFATVRTETLHFREVGAATRFAFPLLVGRYSAAWTFSGGPAMYVLSSLDVDGASDGLAIGCQRCPTGYFCATSTPQLCPPGTYRTRTDPHDACLPCTGNSVAVYYPSAECRFCGNNFVPNTERSSCIPKTVTDVGVKEACMVHLSPSGKEVKYNLSHLEGEHRVSNAHSAEYSRMRFAFGCGGDVKCQSGAIMCTTDVLGEDEVALGWGVHGIAAPENGLSFVFTTLKPCVANPFLPQRVVVDVGCSSVKSDIEIYATGSDCTQGYRTAGPAGCMDCDSYSEASSTWSDCIEGKQQRILNFGDAPQHCVERLASHASTDLERSCSTSTAFVNSPYLIPVLLFALGLILLSSFTVYRLYARHRLMNAQV